MKMRLTRLFILFGIYYLLFAMLGCDAFVRKFTRKPKNDKIVHEEMVLAPEEYKWPEMRKEDLYRQYLLFWQSWHNELIDSLVQGKGQKKKIDCAQEAIKNLNNLKGLLNEEIKEKLDIYIKKLESLKNLISGDLYGIDDSRFIQEAELLKRQILRSFSYQKIKDYLL